MQNYIYHHKKQFLGQCKITLQHAMKIASSCSRCWWVKEQSRHLTAVALRSVARSSTTQVKRFPSVTFKKSRGWPLSCQQPMIASSMSVLKVQCADGELSVTSLTLVQIPSKNWAVLCAVNLVDASHYKISKRTTCGIVPRHILMSPLNLICFY